MYLHKSGFSLNLRTRDEAAFTLLLYPEPVTGVGDGDPWAEAEKEL